MKNIFKFLYNLKGKIKRIKPKALALILVALVLGGFVFSGIALAQNAPYESNIAFKKDNADLLALENKVVTVEPGLSRADMDSLNQEADPELIKKFMQGIAPEYSIDWKLVYAIGYHESGNYGSYLAQTKNNYFGRKATSSEYASWETPEEGIRNQFEYLKRRYFDKGLDTPAKINPVYAEDNSWHLAVEATMDKL